MANSTDFFGLKYALISTKICIYECKFINQTSLYFSSLIAYQHFYNSHTKTHLKISFPFPSLCCLFFPSPLTWRFATLNSILLLNKLEISAKFKQINSPLQKLTCIISLTKYFEKVFAGKPTEKGWNVKYTILNYSYRG